MDQQRHLHLVQHPSDGLDKPVSKPAMRPLPVLAPEVQDSVWLEKAYKVAFATNNGQQVNQHFGMAQQFVIYAIDEQHCLLLNRYDFGQLAMDGNEDKLPVKLDALQDCIAVYSQAIGSSAMQQLQRQNTYPIKVTAGASIQQLLTDLQQELNQGPSGWLKKAINQQHAADPNRFDKMLDEGWDESC